MKVKAVISVVSVLSMVMGAAVSLAGIVSWIMDDTLADTQGILQCSAFSILGGLILYLKTRDKNQEVTPREVYAIVTVGWLSVCLIAAIPFVALTDMSFTDSYFEVMSGLTTTGATILTDIESLPKGLLFWRCFCNWLGGLGIVILSMAILPFLGSGGYQLFKAESTGPQSEQVTSRAIDTAKILWGIYVVLTCLTIGLYRYLEMPMFEAVCHGLSTLSTGGYSPLGSSFSNYGFPVLYVCSFFMMIAATNFTLHIKALKGDIFCYFRDEEFRWYLLTFVFSLTLIAFFLHSDMGYGLADSFAHSTFQVASLETSCGFASDNFDVWPTPAKIVLLLIMFMGGCGGSTTGGMKVARIVLLVKYTFIKIKQMILPHSLINLHFNGRRVSDDMIQRSLAFFFAFIFLYALTVFSLSFVPGIDMTTAMSGAIACLGNMGPGFGMLGPINNFAWLPDWNKWILCGAMFLGRLEIFTVIIVFVPNFWRR